MRALFVVATMTIVGGAFAACGGGSATSADASVDTPATSPTNTAPTTTATCPRELPRGYRDCTGRITCDYPCQDGGLYRASAECFNDMWSIRASVCSAGDAATDGDGGGGACPVTTHSNGVRCTPEHPCVDTTFRACLTGCCIAVPP